MILVISIKGFNLFDFVNVDVETCDTDGRSELSDETNQGQAKMYPKIW